MMTQPLQFESSRLGAHEPKLQLVVSCSNTKTQPIQPDLMVRSLEAGPIQDRLRSWVDRLLSDTSDPVRASDLYGGDHWTVAKSLPHLAQIHGHRAELWVLSAGYGFIRATRPIHPYSATFTPGEPDCVGVASEAVDWWRALAASQLGQGDAQSITNLAQRHPSSTILVVASTPYLRPLAEDLTSALEALDSPDQMMIVSAGLRSSDGVLARHALPVRARMAHLVGGSRVSLNARIAGFLIAEGLVPNHAFGEVAQALEAAQTHLPDPPRFSRSPMSDSDVASFVSESLRAEPHVSASLLLRRLRDSDRACEQKRFHAIYKDVARSQ